MANKPLLTELLSDRASDHLIRVREARHPNSPGGACITDAEAEEIERGAYGVARQSDDLRLVGRMCQQLWHRGPHVGYEKRVERDIADSRKYLDTHLEPPRQQEPARKNARFYVVIGSGRKSNRR